MSPVLQRPCPGCKTRLITPPAKRCAPCQSGYEARRGSPSARGYDAEYRRRRPFILERDGHRCRWCGAEATTVDHVVPISSGGDHSDENLVTSCTRCNVRRAHGLEPEPEGAGSKHPEESALIPPQDEVLDYTPRPLP